MSLSISPSSLREETEFDSCTRNDLSETANPDLAGFLLFSKRRLKLSALGFVWQESRKYKSPARSNRYRCWRNFSFLFNVLFCRCRFVRQLGPGVFPESHERNRRCAFRGSERRGRLHLTGTLGTVAGQLSGEAPARPSAPAIFRVRRAGRFPVTAPRALCTPRRGTLNTTSCALASELHLSGWNTSRRELCCLTFPRGHPFLAGKAGA